MNTARPLGATARDPITAPLARKRTSPVGVPVAGGTTATVAVSVIGAARPAGLGVTVRSVVVAVRPAGGCIGIAGIAIAAGAANAVTALTRGGNTVAAFATVRSESSGVSRATSRCQAFAERERTRRRDATRAR